MRARTNPIRYALTGLGASTACVLAMLAVAQAILYVQDREASDSIADAVITRIETISIARRAAAVSASRIKGIPCSDSDIDALKDIAFRSSYVSDVGRIRNRRLVCSALWGNARPLDLPAPRYSGTTFLLWHASDLVGSPYKGSNLIAEGNTFTVSSPSAFESLDPAGDSLISIETKDRSFTYRHLAPRNGVNPRATAAVRSQRCSGVADACVFVTSPRHMASDLPGSLIASILAAGASAGLLLAFILIRHQITTRQTIQQRFAHALKQNEIELTYQPLRRVGTRELVGFEALSRWRPPGDDEIPPAVFVPIAHQLGLSPDLFRYVLNRAMTDLATSLRQNPALYVSINAEPLDMAQECVVKFVSGVTGNFGLLPEQLRIEITEREKLVSTSAKINMQALSALGYRFLIDDFGTGSANFAHLAQSPFQGIKIDRMFVSALTEETPLRPVLPGMYRIARELGLDVIVEGVETEELDELLFRIAPDAVGQGWYYGHPLSLSNAMTVIDTAQIKSSPATLDRTSLYPPKR